MAVSEETREMEREQNRRELQAMRSQCGEAQVRIDLLLKAEARLQEEVRSGGYPAAEARAESSERFLRTQLAAREFERQAHDLRQVEEAQQRKIDMLQKAIARSAEQLATKVIRAPGGSDSGRLHKDVQEYRRLADTYREQRDKLQEQWDAWE
jgi:hypothetical protein